MLVKLGIYTKLHHWRMLPWSQRSCKHKKVYIPSCAWCLLLEAP